MHIVLLTLLLLGPASYAHTGKRPTDVSQTILRLDHALDACEFGELRNDINELAAGAEREYYLGVLANRSGLFKQSIVLLRAALRDLSKDERDHRSTALASLADDYLKLYRYKRAVEVLTILVSDYADTMDADSLAGTQNRLDQVRMMRDFPPQTVSGASNSSISLRRNPIDVLEATVLVNGIEIDATLDTGANLSVLTERDAKRLHVKTSAGVAYVKAGTTGQRSPVRVGLLSTLQLGKTKVRNVVVLILKDESLRIPTGTASFYQIHAIIGYPVFQSLGRVTFTQDKHLLLGAGSASYGAASRMFVNELTLLIEAEVDGRSLLFSFDTGASESEFTNKFYAAFPEKFQALTPIESNLGGVGGATKRKLYILPQQRMTIGGRTAVLRNIATVPLAIGTNIDCYFGNLGQDLTNSFASFTLDFHRMKFGLGEPIEIEQRTR